MPTAPFGRPTRVLAMLAALSGLSACAEPFVYQSTNSAAPSLFGQATMAQPAMATSTPSMPTAGAAAGSTTAQPRAVQASATRSSDECGPMDFHLSFLHGGTIAGDARDGRGHWWVSGELYENGNVLVQLWQPRLVWPGGPPIAPGAKPFETWRGAIADRELHLFEQPPATCRRGLEIDAAAVDPVDVTRTPE